MLVRPSTLSDIEKIKKLHSSNDYELDLDLLNTLADRVVIENGKIVGYGTLKKLVEAVIVLDKEQSIRKKIEIINKLMIEMLQFCTMTGDKEIHTYAKDDFSSILERHFHFTPVLEKALFLEIR